MRVLCVALAALVAAPPLAAQISPADSARARADRDRRRGADTASVVLYLLSDFQCPYCRAFATATWPALDSVEVRRGALQVVFVPLPLPAHPEAWSAGEAALCAGAQGAFWRMHDRLFAAQAEWSGRLDAGTIFDGYAAALGLDTTAFRRCRQEDWMAPVLLADLFRTVRAGVAGTPTLVLQRRVGGRPNGEPEVLTGAVPPEAVRQALRRLRSPAGAGRSPPPGA
jgi:protein-disulfide isomerase